jgi:adsorption protein B
VTLPLWAMLWLIGLILPIPPRPLSPTIVALLWINLGLMSWRGLMRALFVGHAYGWRYGLGAVPRTFIANLIAILAARRAVFQYARSLLGQPLKWDKTQHRFPDMRSDP